MRLGLPVFAALSSLILPAAVLADGTISRQIGADGLRATEAALAALPDPTAEERFALGGVRFLAAIETALQTRWKHGVPQDIFMVMDMPLLRLPIAENPTPAPFDGAVVTELFTQVEADMAGALTALAGVQDEAVTLRIDTGDLWFDINRDGQREAGEGIGDLAMFGMTGIADGVAPKTVIQFDSADAAWLTAYAHLLSGLSTAVLAVDPAAAIDRALTGSAAMAAYWSAAQPAADWSFRDSFDGYADALLIVIEGLEGPVDPDLSQATLDHWLAMIAANRDFWRLVAAETDNEAEWIPNKAQTSAIGLVLPADTGQVWLNVLAEGERALRGEVLIPHWRLPDGVGLNLNAFLTAPPADLDLLGLIHGVDALPYVETGPLISGDALWRFESLVGGDAGLYMVILN
jgi:hypothetical protein